MQPPRFRGVSPLQIYLNQIHEQEYEPPTPEQENTLALDTACGDPQAREQLIKGNLRLVVSIARRFTGRGLSLEDLISEGNLGLLHAVEGFNPALGHRFIAFATSHIRGAMKSAIEDQGKPIRLPQEIRSLVTQRQDIVAALGHKQGHSPTDEEVDDEVMTSLELEATQLPMLRQAAHSQRINWGTRAVDYQGRDCLVRYPDYRTSAPADPIQKAEALTKALWRLSRLTDQQYTVVSLRLGLGTGKPLTLKQVAKELKFRSREGIRKIEEKAFAKLGAVPEYSKCLQQDAPQKHFKKTTRQEIGASSSDNGTAPHTEEASASQAAARKTRKAILARSGRRSRYPTDSSTEAPSRHAIEFGNEMQAIYQRTGHYPSVGEILTGAKKLGWVLGSQGSTPEDGDQVLTLASALSEYKLLSGRRFFKWSEVLEIMQNLGYAKLPKE